MRGCTLISEECPGVVRESVIEPSVSLWVRLRRSVMKAFPMVSTRVINSHEGEPNIYVCMAHFFAWVDADFQEPGGLVVGASHETGTAGSHRSPRFPLNSAIRRSSPHTILESPATSNGSPSCEKEGTTVEVPTRRQWRSPSAK